MTSTTPRPAGAPTGREFSEPPAALPFRLSFRVLECTARNEPDRDTFVNRLRRFKGTFDGGFWVLPDGRLARKDARLDLRHWLESRLPRLFPRRAVPHVVLDIDLCTKENSDNALGLPYGDDEQQNSLKPGSSTARWKLDLRDEDPNYRDSIISFNGDFFLASVVEHRSLGHR